jgi:hypothetical protein
LSVATVAHASFYEGKQKVAKEAQENGAISGPLYTYTSLEEFKLFLDHPQVSRYLTQTAHVVFLVLLIQGGSHPLCKKKEVCDCHTSGGDRRTQRCLLYMCTPVSFANIMAICLLLQGRPEISTTHILQSLADRFVFVSYRPAPPSSLSQPGSGCAGEHENHKGETGWGMIHPPRCLRNPSLRRESQISYFVGTSRESQCIFFSFLFR